MGAIPHDEFGRPINALVYGPSTLAKQLETVNGQALWPYYIFGVQGYAYTDGGSLAGGWTWMGNQIICFHKCPVRFISNEVIPKTKKKREDS